MKHILLTLAVVLIGLSAYCGGGLPEAPCSATLDSVYVIKCTGDTFYLDTNAYTHTGVYYDSLTNTAGCDSVIAWFVYFNPPVYDTITRAVCQGDTVHFGDSVYAQTGVYYDTVRNGYCIVSCGRLILIVNPLPVVTFTWDSMYATGGFLPSDEQEPLNSMDSLTARWCEPPSYGFHYVDSLAGGTPFGGKYSGKGIYNNVFYGDTLYYYGQFQGADSIVYTYVDSNGCSSSKMNILDVYICEGITTIPGANLFSLYPNPADDYTTINFDASYTGAAIFVSDITGRQLYQTQLSHSPQQIPTGNLLPGIYLVTMSTGEQVGARLLVKE